MPLIGEPFFPRPRDSHGFVRFGIVRSLSAVHQWAQDKLLFRPFAAAGTVEIPESPGAGMGQIAHPSKGGTVLQGSSSEIAEHGGARAICRVRAAKTRGIL